MLFFLNNTKAIFSTKLYICLLLHNILEPYIKWR